MALNAQQVQELQRLALGAGVCVGVDFEYRAVPLFQQLAGLLHQGAIGTPWLVKLDWLMGSRADARRPWSWYSQRSEGGGVLGALGTHAFDTLHWLVGPSRALSATCAPLSSPVMYSTFSPRDRLSAACSSSVHA